MSTKSAILDCGSPMSSQKTIDQLSAIQAAGKFDPFIEYVRFPRYKNLTSNFRIDFTFPVTALVGPNGTNKSSILVALQGAPANRSPGQFWFSTAVDPPRRTGSRILVAQVWSRESFRA
jgi:predicted ATPase